VRLIGRADITIYRKVNGDWVASFEHHIATSNSRQDAFNSLVAILKSHNTCFFSVRHFKFGSSRNRKERE